MTVTTIITTYNHEQFVAQAIESAIAQQGDFIHRILISDDASSDGTRKIIQVYAAKFPHLVTDISSDVNLGISGNMKKCFARAEGEYIAVLEGDDYWTDVKKLEKQVRYLEEHADCPLVFSRIQLNTDGKMSLLSRHAHLKERVSLGDILTCESMNPICNFSCCLFRREFAQAIPEVAYEGRLSEVTVAFYLAQLGSLGYIPEVLSDYRIHAQGTYAGADEISRCKQAIQTFRTTRKVAPVALWPKLTEMIRSLEGQLRALQDKKRIRFSIVTIAYQNLEGLKLTAESVHAQTFHDYEWIVVDGGSSDGTRDYLERLDPAPDRWVSESDKGVYDAMNKGIAMARGAYVICMNAGDTFRRAETLNEVARCGLKADVVYGDWRRKYPTSYVLMRAPDPLPPFHFLQPGGGICHQAMFVRTEILQTSPFDVSYRVLADLAKWCHLMLEGRSFAKIPVVVCDFEAGTGLSEQQSPARLLDQIRLRAEFQDGLLLQAAELFSFLKKRATLLCLYDFARKIYRCIKRFGHIPRRCGK